MYNSSGPRRAHHSVHVRDIQRARYVRSEPDRFVSEGFGTHHEHRDGLLRRGAALSSLLRNVAKPPSLSVER